MVCMPLLHWLRLALYPATVRRALLTSAIVGTTLTLINHGDALLRGEVDTLRAIRIGLNLFVPYMVSTVSSVATRLELASTATTDAKKPATQKTAAGPP